MEKKSKKQDRFADREAQNYQNPIPSREYILELLEERARPATFRQIIDELGLSDEDEQEALRRRLLAMVRDGQLHQNRRGVYGLVTKMELIPGIVIGHRDGFGFVDPDDGSDDLFLNARQMRAAFHNDKVLVRVSNLDNRGRREGVIVDVLERHTEQLVGRFFTESGISFVKPANTRITQDIMVPPDQVGSARNGEMVVVEITSQPTHHSRPIGKIAEILGEHMAPGMEVDVAIRNHDLPHEWPEEVLKEAEQFKAEVPESELTGREDLRALPFVTIDGEDAKDFDDAVYCKPLAEGGWRLYVAIADVSHYVKPNTALGREALNRGNSVYFPGCVIPMLPEVLSNQLCSLNPHVNRLTLVCEMMIDAEGKIQSHRFCEAMIKSHARLTYNQVYDMVEMDNKELQAQFKDLFPHLRDLFVIFHTLRDARQRRGAIDFDMPETKIIFGEGRKIEKIIPLKRNDAHRVIEECMLCANISAALFLLENQFPALYRIHEGPALEKLMDLRKFLNELGLSMPGGELPKPRDYASLLKSIAERPDAHLIQSVLLRSLSQAVYSGENKGHFGLAYEAYTHFTSPIRRYPDLLVHRAIRKILRRGKSADETGMALEKSAEHCSMTERRADDATREAVDWLKCEFMLDKVGEEFDGIITSVTSFGLFIELKDIYVEGLAHISTLHNDYYQFDPIKRALLGERSGRRYRLGDPVRVKVARVNLDEREMDFQLMDEIGESNTPKKANSKKAKPKKNKKKKNLS